MEHLNLSERISFRLLSPERDSAFLYQLLFCFSYMKWPVNKALVLLGKFFNSKFNKKDVIMAHVVF